jgi:hypothetical protein
MEQKHLPCVPQCVLLFHLQALKQAFGKHPVTSAELKQDVLLVVKCSVQQQHKELELT